MKGVARSGLSAWSLLVSAIVPGAVAAPLDTQCSSLASSLNIANSSNVTSSLVSAGTTLTDLHLDRTCGPATQRVSADICRVAMNISTSATSGFRMEVWLPLNWTGRFLSTGNGGLGGCLQFADVDYATSLGFAAVGTNNGHDGMSGVSFLNNPGVIEDFAYRALHTGVVLGKDITKAFYNRTHDKSYYLGCSTGGRQGMKEVQMFPEDFDGVVAGAPAMAFNNLTSWSCHFLPLTGPTTAATFVPMNMWPAIHDEILRQCDTLDGAADGILESPDLCQFSVDPLVCGASNGINDTCLTPTQADTLRAIYSPLLSVDGSLVYPRLQPGAELTGAPQTYFNGQRFGAADWFSYAIFNDTNWDPFSLTPADYVRSSNLNLFNIETFDADLSAFQARGSKLLHYHGLADGTISSENSPRYYQKVSDTMGLAPAQLDDFYRYFTISGMAHCGGGPGASNIGNTAASSASLDPRQNVLMAMVQWVEQGIAPETITGTAYVNGSRANGVAFQRRHCKWPARNHYVGPGNVTDVDAWQCS